MSRAHEINEQMTQRLVDFTNSSWKLIDVQIQLYRTRFTFVAHEISPATAATSHCVSSAITTIPC
jgi:hypothetical protein